MASTCLTRSSLDVGLLQHRRIHAGQEPQHILERPEFLNLPHGTQEIFEIQALLGRDLLGQPHGFLFIYRHLRLLDQGQEIALLENAACHPGREECAEGIARLSPTPTY